MGQVRTGDEHGGRVRRSLRRGRRPRPGRRRRCHHQWPPPARGQHGPGHRREGPVGYDDQRAIPECCAQLSEQDVVEPVGGVPDTGVGRAQRRRGAVLPGQTAQEERQQVQLVQHGNGRAEVVQAEGRRDRDRTQPTIEGEVHDHRGVPEATAQLAHVDHGPAVPVLHELDLLPFFLRRLAWQRGTPASLRAADAGVRHAANRLDDVLFGQLRTTLGDRPLVVVPNGALSAMPWSVLPSCRGRPLVVAPSATTWTRAAAAPQAPADSPTVLVAGPDLPHARVEVDALRRHYPTARTLTGPAATADAVVAALEGAGLAHVAAHGHFRADNPQFSSLRLHDGPLTVYDLECLHAAPHQVILSACNSGRTPDLASDEVLGLVAVFLALGTTTLIASVAPVPDEETASLMADLHARLVRGAPPAVALAGAQEAAGADGAALAASSGFVCFGAS